MTLIEMLIVLAIMAALAALVVPNVSGFLGQGKQSAYDGDRQMLQAAVDAWRTDTGRRVGRTWPILLGDTTCLGTVNMADGAITQAGCNPYLDIGALATENYIRDASAVVSAKPSFNTTATNSKAGTYGWFLTVGGIVTSYPTYQEGRYP